MNWRKNSSNFMIFLYIDLRRLKCVIKDNKMNKIDKFKFNFFTFFFIVYCVFHIKDSR